METRSYNFHKSKINVVTGNIVESDSQVIVSSDDTLLTMGGGVSMSIRQAGGQFVQFDAQRHLPAKVGDVIVSTAGELKQEYIFHCLTIDKEYLKETRVGLNILTSDKVEYIIRSSVDKCFRLMTVLNIDSIAFPLIGSGNAHMPYFDVLNIMVDEIGANLLKTNKDITVEIYVYNPSINDERDICDIVSAKAAVINYLTKKQEDSPKTRKVAINLTNEELKGYRLNDHQVFVSYSRMDQEKAFEILETLESWGLKVWIDKNGIFSSNNYKTMIEDAIENTKAVVFLSSENSNKSEYVRKEIGYAVKLKKPIIPIMLDQTPFGEGLRLDLSDVDQVDYSNYEDGLRKLRMSMDYILTTTNSK